MIKMKNVFYWLLAIIITLSAVIYQRMTGPTNPKRIKFELSGKEYKTKLTRSIETTITLEEAMADYNLLSKKGILEIEIPNSPESMKVMVFYKRYPSNDSIQSLSAVKKGDIFSIQLPAQPPAAKISYFVEFMDSTDSVMVGLNSNIIVRFKNPVPPFVLIPHILLMFIAMLLSTYTGVIAFTGSAKVGKYALMVIITLGVGGLILGPIVQKFAFGAYWTGWPFGEDMTDNKTIIAFALWLVAWYVNKLKPRKWLYVLAAVIMLLVYSIPHSRAGSEYDYSKGKVITGA